MKCSIVCDILAIQKWSHVSINLNNRNAPIFILSFVLDTMCNLKRETIYICFFFLTWITFKESPIKSRIFKVSNIFDVWKQLLGLKVPSPSYDFQERCLFFVGPIWKGLMGPWTFVTALDLCHLLLGWSFPFIFF